MAWRTNIAVWNASLFGHPLVPQPDRTVRMSGGAFRHHDLRAAVAAARIRCFATHLCAGWTMLALAAATRHPPRRARLLSRAMQAHDAVARHLATPDAQSLTDPQRARVRAELASLAAWLDRSGTADHHVALSGARRRSPVPGRPRVVVSVVALR